MTLEEELFVGATVKPKKLLEYGFQKQKGYYL